MRRTISRSLLLSLLLAGCGDVVVIPPEDSGTGGGGVGATPPEGSGTGGRGPVGTPVAADYAAYFWAPDHLTMVKADPEAGRCVKLHGITPPESRPGFDVAMPEGWSIVSAEITDRAADCDGPRAEPLGNVVRASGATGTLSWEPGPDGFALCDLDVEVTVTSPGEPAADLLRASGLRASGACCPSSDCR